MKLSFSTLACPGYSWAELYSVAKDFGFHGIEMRGLGGDIFDVHASPFLPENLPETNSLYRAFRSLKKQGRDLRPGSIFFMAEDLDDLCENFYREKGGAVC